MRARILALVGAFALVLVASGSAKTINGTDRNDTLRGTPKADKLYGKKGNDKLYGLAGNDLFVPGPGRDRVYCGAGLDSVIADGQDVVAKDCEVVRRSGPPKAPPPPPPAPPPANPPPPAAVAGRYAGQTTQAERVSFEVLPGGASLKDFFVNSINMSCQPPNIVSFYGTSDAYRIPKTAPIAPDGSFAIAATVDFTDASGVRWQWEARIPGRLSGQSASGDLVVTATVTVPGFPVPITCNAPNVKWTASRLP